MRGLIAPPRPLPPALAPTSAYQVLRSGGQCRGGNIMVKNSDLLAGDAVWASFWTEWDWTGWIKFQVDLARTVGANCIRLIGSVYVVTHGDITRATYLARWQQLIEYCAGNGLYVYVVTGAQNDQLLGCTDTQIGQEGGALAATLDQWAPWVLGVDMMQESHVWLTAPRAQTISGCVNVATRVPTTFSREAGSVADLNSTTYRDVLRPFVDFWDYHIYYDIGLTDMATFWSTETKRCLFGEFGQTLSAGNPGVQSRYNAVKAISLRTEAGGQRVAGALAWETADQQTDPTGQYGMFDGSGVPRTVFTNIFTTFPVT